MRTPWKPVGDCQIQHKLLRCYQSPTVWVLKWTTTILQMLGVSGLNILFQSFLLVDPSLYRYRRSSCHSHPLILSSTSTATILQSLSMSGLKALYQVFLPIV